MRWLLVGTLSNAVREALVRHEHIASTPAEVGIDESATPEEVLAAAHQKQLDVLTDRADIANVLFEKPTKFIRTLVYLQLKGGEVEQDDAIDRLFTRYKRLATGRLYTVTETRVKIRQLPGH
jgi:hypothetical protein